MMIRHCALLSTSTKCIGVANGTQSTRYRCASRKQEAVARRGHLQVVAGERRSANRTTWTTGRGSGSVAILEEEEDDDRTIEQQDDEGPSFDDVSVFETAARLSPLFAELDQLIAFNTRKVQEAFSAARVGPHHWAGSTGYGHGDIGREALDQIMAQIMGAESAMVRRSFTSGTHAIASALYATLRPGQEIISVAGSPYDTMEEVIGLRGIEDVGSLIDWGVKYKEIPLTPQGRIDLGAIRAAITPGLTRVAYVQRSCGYALRPTLSIDDIERIVQTVKSVDKDCLVLVDNCYGEFTEDREPCEVGADMAMGSLIKNPGGTIAPGGGYVVGPSSLLDKVSARLSAPGVGRDAGGISADEQRLLMQGLFLAPQMVGEAIKGGRLIAETMHQQGFNVTPSPGKCTPNSFITAVEVGSAEKMVAFCRAVQSSSPVGSYILPEPGVTAGYESKVIFADGTFIDGSTAELSADGPLREPFVVYCQGGTHWTHWAIVLERVQQEMLKVLDADSSTEK